MAEVFPENEFETPGELQTARRLRDELPKRWKIITNKMFTSSSGTTNEVDFIIVGEHRIFVADGKGYRGKIYGNDSSWSLGAGESIRNPLGKMEGVARKLAGHLCDKVPSLKKEMNGSHFVDAIIILSDPTVEINTQGPHRSKVMRLDSASQKLIDFDKGDGNNLSLIPFHDSILKSLDLIDPAPSVPKMIGAYKVKEKLEKGPHYRAFLAEHEASGKNTIRRLKVYEVAGLDDEEQKHQKKLIFRDYEVLRQLTHEGLAPAVDPPFVWGDERFIVVPQHIVSLPSLRTIALPTGISGAPEVLTPLEALNAGRSLLETLARLHELKILHRNLTPDNIFVDRSTLPWRTVLADFDFARLPEADSIAILANAVEIAGLYRAPELAVSLSFASEKSDVYAAGVILTELLANVKAQDVIDEAGQIQVPPLNLEGCDLPEASRKDLRQLLQDMVCKDAAQRWDSVQDAITWFEEPISEVNSIKVSENKGDDTPPGPIRLFQRGDVIERRYEVERILGQGATATTYLVRDLVFEGNYVLKQIRDSALAYRFAGNEFRILSSLSHPGIMRIYDVMLPESAYHLKIEFVDGKSLDELRGEFPWPMERVLNFGRDILAALAYLEVNGVAHRDLSARNIIVTDHGPKLIDFGLAAPLQEIGYTQVGTIAYRAPELDRGESGNPTCDTYSVGVLLFWMLTGQHPFVSDANGRLDKSQLVQMPVSISDNPHLISVLRVLHRALATSPRERFQSATDMANALQVSETSGPVIIGWPPSANKKYYVTVRGCGLHDVEGQQFKSWPEAYNAAIVVRKAFSNDIPDKSQRTKWRGNGNTALWLGDGPDNQKQMIHIDPHDTGEPNPIGLVENGTPVSAVHSQLNSSAFGKGKMTQRDKMRQIFRLLGDDKEAVIEAYANAERAGEVDRLRNASDYGTRQYAQALWNDGKKKGWL